MLKLAFHNLVNDRARLMISAGGVGLAVVLILVMAGVFAGSEEHAVAYIRNQPALLWLMQAGVENLHMSTSILDPDTVERTRGVAGVADAVGLLYASGGVDLGDTVVYSYLFAIEDGAAFGGPWKLAEGSAYPPEDGVVIDRVLAARHGLDLGDQVGILGTELTITGLSEGTFGIATSITFLNWQTLARLMGLPPGTPSYVLIRPEPGADLAALAGRLRVELPQTNVIPREDFIASDQEMIRQMGADILSAMNGISYVVGLLVIALTVYTAALERSREFGMLKAIGADLAALLRAVLAQAYLSAGLGFLAGTALAYGLAALISRLLPEMLILIEPERLLRQIPVFLVLTGLAALPPIARVARQDPLVVFKG